MPEREKDATDKPAAPYCRPLAVLTEAEQPRLAANCEFRRQGGCRNKDFTMAQTKPVKTLLKDLEPNELREVIQELCKLSPKNKQFLELYLQGSDTVDLNSVVEEAKKKVHAYFYGRSLLPKLDLQSARKVVTEYTKLFKDYPHLIAELKLYYVEVGTSVTEQYGDMYEGFYNSLVSMFESFCKDVTKHSDWYHDFETRIKALQSVTSHMGWGYGDDIDHLAVQLQGAVQKGEEAE